MDGELNCLTPLRLRTSFCSIATFMASNKAIVVSLDYQLSKRYGEEIPAFGVLSALFNYYTKLFYTTLL